jgi:hypothetical protein
MLIRDARLGASRILGWCQGGRRFPTTIVSTQRTFAGLMVPGRGWFGSTVAPRPVQKEFLTRPRRMFLLCPMTPTVYRTLFPPNSESPPGRGRKRDSVLPGKNGSRGTRVAGPTKGIVRDCCRHPLAQRSAQGLRPQGKAGRYDPQSARARLCLRAPPRSRSTTKI